MNAKLNSVFPLPTTGACIATIAKLFGITTKAAKYTSKEFERLITEELSARPRCGSMPKIEAVGREVIDEIVGAIAGKSGEPVTTQVLNDKDLKILKYSFFVTDSEGRLRDIRDHLVRDFIEFIHRHQMLVRSLGCGETVPYVIHYWLGFFVIPFVVENLVHYQINGNSIERGMPRGRFWYLPEPIISDGKVSSIKWPVNTVLEWWQDLLGAPLQDYAHQLCAPGLELSQANLKTAKRQVQQWLYENRTPSLSTINRWCGQTWNYKGAFKCDARRRIAEQWDCCKAFLVSKGFDQPSANWLEKLPSEFRNDYGPSFTGHALELEILPFPGVPFEVFLRERDPIRKGFPVSEFIDRVAERFAPPTNG
jgi:hypothetical protein